MEIKRTFRLRPVDTTELIARKYAYLRSPCIRFVTWKQLLMGIVIIITQIILLSNSRRKFKDDLAGLGIVFGSLEILASAFILMAAEDPAYYWFHLAMIFNLLSAIGFYCLGRSVGYVLIDLQKFKTAESTSPYTNSELEMLINCCYIIAILSILSCTEGIFLAIVTSHPVCCGQRDALPTSGICRRTKKASNISLSSSGSSNGSGISPNMRSKFRTDSDDSEAGCHFKFSQFGGSGTNSLYGNNNKGSGFAEDGKKLDKVIP